MFLTTFCARTGTAPHTGHVEELSEEHFVSKRDEQANKELTGESRRSVGISRSPFDPPLKLLSQARPPRLRKASFKPYAPFSECVGPVYWPRFFGWVLTVRFPKIVRRQRHADGPKIRHHLSRSPHLSNEWEFAVRLRMKICGLGTDHRGRAGDPCDTWTSHR